MKASLFVLFVLSGLAVAAPVEGFKEHEIINSKGVTINGRTFEGYGDSEIGGALQIWRVGASVIGCDFSGNVNTRTGDDGSYVGGGAIWADLAITVTDSNFQGNYVLAPSTTATYPAKGGAICMIDSEGYKSCWLSLVAKDRDVVFSGNKIGVESVDAQGKLVGGIANSIWMEKNQYPPGSNGHTIWVDASAKRTISFRDPIVYNVKSSVYSTEEDKLVQQNIVFNGQADSTGSIVFTGEDYKEQDAINRMSRIERYTGMTQNEGRVVITEKAILGASMESSSDENAKVGALNYVMNKGNLEISQGGRLMAGSVQILGAGGSEGGFSQCTLTVGSGALLTTGWLKMDTGVTFDLAPFLDEQNSGLKVNFVGVDEAPNTVFKDPVFAEDGPRAFLGGVVGISDTIDYTEGRWSSEKSFLLLDFSGRTETQTMTGDFKGIQSLSTNSDVVPGKGSWSLKWDDGSETAPKNMLYAVWKPYSVPEPSTATLAILGCCSLIFRRRR